MVIRGITIPEDKIAEFCKRHRVTKLSLFGSILRDDFGPTSDIDVLVEFEPGRTPGLIAFAGMQLELTDMLARQVDLRTPDDLSRYFRNTVLREAKPLHAA